MAIYLEDNAGGPGIELDISVDDGDGRAALWLSACDAEGIKKWEYFTTSKADMLEFFRQVDVAKTEWSRLVPPK